ncbi:MAG: hypothetical protein FJX76_04550 [Armatimonadetes bacterium]|nr:hypothetical protein [Armatimonadota bacterium]
MQAPPKLTAHLVRVEQSVRDVSLGQMAIEDFVAMVDELDALFQQKLSEVEGMEVPADCGEEINAEMEVGRRGIEWYLVALQDLREYVNERSLSSLQAGLEKARMGNDLLNEALQMNWATYQFYRQAAEEYLAQQGL